MCFVSKSCFQDPDFDDMMMLAGKATCALKSAETVQGLQAWYRKISNGHKLIWAKALGLMAAGK
jgi:hypothetical protein